MAGSGGQCPKCRELGCKLVDSRKIDFYGEKIIRRRRECHRCEIRFNTFEVSEDIIRHYKTLRWKNLSTNAANDMITKKARTLSFFINDLERFLKEFKEA
jgi:C4-type Zn-finger protein